MSGEVGGRIVAEVTRQIRAAELTTDWKMFDVWVPGKSQPQGSKVRNRFSGVREDNKELGPWRERVALQASADMHSLGYVPVPAKEPVLVTCQFVLPRLASAPKTRPHPPATTKPDLDKLVRAILDALTGPVLFDDGQVIEIRASKSRAGVDAEPGVWIQVERKPL